MIKPWIFFLFCYSFIELNLAYSREIVQLKISAYELYITEITKGNSKVVNFIFFFWNCGAKLFLNTVSMCFELGMEWVNLSSIKSWTLS